jgi:hypothetical protein
MYMMQRAGFLLVLLFAPAALAYGQIPVHIVQSSLENTTTLEDAETSRAFFGELLGFPHTYEIIETKEFHLFVEIRVPDIPSSMDNVSGIIVRQVEGSGRVEEVARLRAGEAAWESVDDVKTGDTYRGGPLFEGEVPPGTYRIEVSTPDNLAKYVVRMGTKEDESGAGYFESLRRIGAVKVFFGKSKFSVVESPLVFVPLGAGGILAVILGYLWLRKREHADSGSDRDAIV